MHDEQGLRALQDLGARSVPVVARGGRYVYAQVIKDVVDFLELDDDTAPVLSPSALATRYLSILATAVRLTRQMPDSCLDRQLPNRPRAWRTLMHHLFQIPNAFLDMEQTGEPMRYENMVAPPPDSMRSSDDIADFGESVLARFDAWWRDRHDSDFSQTVTVYFGSTSRHEMLERTVWHSTQHVRQLASLLEQAQVAPDSPLTSEDTRGLPLTEKIWDET